LCLPVARLPGPVHRPALRFLLRPDHDDQLDHDHFEHDYDHDALSDDDDAGPRSLWYLPVGRVEYNGALRRLPR